VSEDSVRENSRRLGSIALVLYATSVLVIIVGVITAMGITFSNLSSVISGPWGPVTPEMARTITGLVFIGIGFIIYAVFAIYAGFKGRSVVSNVNLMGWESLIENLGKLYFVATLLLAIGVFIIPRTSFVYKNVIIALIAALLLMISAFLMPSRQQSITAGVLLIVGAVLSFFAGTFQVPWSQQMGGFHSVLSTILLSNALVAVALIVVGVALIVRGVIYKPLIYNSVASVGGIIYAVSLAYNGFSLASYLSELSSSPYVSGAVESAYWILYGTSITGCSLLGIAGILGLVALILAIVFTVKSGFPSIMGTTVSGAATPPTAKPPAAKPAEETVEQLEKLIEKLDERLALGEISETVYKEIKSKYEKRIKELKREEKGKAEQNSSMED